jgi:hypothetical protein
MSGWKAETKEGNSPVHDIANRPEQDPEYHGARETQWETGGTTLQA